MSVSGFIISYLPQSFVNSNMFHAGQRGVGSAYTADIRGILAENFVLTGMKQDLETLPLNARRDDTVRGYLFMVFIALIIRMRLQMILKETGLSKQYSVEKLLLELEKIKVFELSQGQILQSEVSKKNREILTAFNVCA